MVQRPKLKSFLTVFPISDTTWGLRGGNDELWKIKLKDETAFQTFTRVLAYLNGRHSVEEILAALEGQGIPREEVQQLLSLLARSNLIEEAEAHGLSEQELARFKPQIDLFARFTSRGGACLQALLGKSRVAVLGQGDLARTVCRQLESAGVGRIDVLAEDPPAPQHPTAERGEERPCGTSRLQLDRQAIWPGALPDPPPQLFFVPLEAHDPALLESMDRFAKRHRVPWMLLQVTDFSEGWVGPLFIPGETACYLSLEARLRSNTPFPREDAAFAAHLRAQQRPSAPCGGLFAFHDLLAGIAVTEAVKFLTDVKPPALAGRFLTLNGWSWELEVHDVLKLPRIGLEHVPAPSAFPWKEVSRSEDPLAPWDDSAV